MKNLTAIPWLWPSNQHPRPLEITYLPAPRYIYSLLMLLKLYRQQIYLLCIEAGHQKRSHSGPKLDPWCTTDVKAIIVNRIVGLWKCLPRDIRGVSSVADRDKIIVCRWKGIH